MICGRLDGRGPGQLARECRAGVWLTAAAAGSFVLQHGQDGDAMWHKARAGCPDFIPMSSADALPIQNAVAG